MSKNSVEIKLNKISVSYSEKKVLRDFSLEIKKGELVALLGSSGCGKSTVLKTIAGLIQPSAGGIYFDSEEMNEIPAEKRDAVMMFQKPLLFPYLNVAENVGFGLKMRKVPKAEINEKVEIALQNVQLSGFEKRFPHQLSGGQEQRVALARALIVNPKVLLLDEPFSALDVNLRAEMRSLVREIQRSLNLTVIFVTHDQAEACSIADRIALMNEGNLEQFGIPKEFFTKPQTIFSATFFGWKVLPIHKIGIENEFSNFAEFKTGKAAFHPSLVQVEKIDSVPKEEKIQLTGTIETVSDLGTQFIYHLRLFNDESLEIVQSATETFSINERVRLSIPVTALIKIE